MPTAFADALSALAEHLNSLTPNRRPLTIEGATPVGRSTASLPSPSGGTPFSATPSAFGGTGSPAAGSPAATDLASLASNATTGSPNNNDTGSAGPGPKQSANLEKQITKLTGRETAVAQRGANRVTRVSNREQAKEKMLGGRVTKLTGRESMLTSKGKLGKATAVGKRITKVQGREATVAQKAGAKIDQIGAQVTARQAKIQNRITRKQTKLFG